MTGSMRRLSALIFGLILTAALTLTLAVPAAAFAEDNGTVPTRITKYFNVDVQVNENNSYEFTETVGTVFNTEGHGIYRYVPMTFDGIREQVGGGWCSTDPLNAYEEDDNYILQMGSGDSYIFGDHEFRYGYDIIFRDDRDESGDYMYIDVLPTNWQTPIESADINIEMPKAIEKDWISVYIGQYGSEADDTMASWELNGGGKNIRIHEEDLDKGVGITVLARLPEGYWVGVEDDQGTKTAATGLPALLALILGGLWARFGRRQSIVETVEFHPPEGVTPAEIGLIIDGVLDKKDMVSMFVYFAQKGYMKIEEVSKREFVFTKLQDIDLEEKPFAVRLFDGLFNDGDEVHTDNMSEDFAYSYKAACETLQDDYGDVTPTTTKLMQLISGFALYAFALVIPLMGMSYMLRGDISIFVSVITALIAIFLTGRLRKSYRYRMTGRKIGSRMLRIVLWIIDIAALLVTAYGVSNAFDSVIVGAIYFLGFGACQYFNVCCDRLTDKAAEHMGKILGLKNFIQTAEIDRIEALVEDDPEYFYSVLPYAYVMGLTNKWIKKFENINVTVPDWYSTYDTSGPHMIVFHMGNSMGGMTSAVTTSVATHLSPDLFSGSDSGGGWSGGGGFSGGGGGFSGGGGGGGGGGFW